MSQEIEASIQYFDKLWREAKLEDMKRRSNPSCALREIQRRRREEMMERIDRGMDDISKILEKMLPQIQNDYKESRKNDENDKEGDEKEEEKEENNESDEEVDRKEEKKECENEKQEKNSLKSWNAT